MYISKSVKNLFKKMIRKPYYYVSPCPLCESKVTGRFVPMHHATEMNWIIEESLKNGEIVSATNEIDEHNCFCMECDATWYEPIPIKLFTLARIDEERKNRLTEEFLNELHNPDSENEAKINRKAKGISGLFINFVGKL